MGLLAGNTAAQKMSLRRVADAPEAKSIDHTPDSNAIEHLDLEVMVGGERKLFPLLPGTQCPTGHTCRSRTRSGIVGNSPTDGAFKDKMGTQLSASLDWNEFQKKMDVIVASDDYCTRRRAMAQAAGMAAGVAAASAASPAYAAETKEVQMGADSGLLVFVPAKTTICKGDSVKWINNKAGPHNVVFDEDAIPNGVSQEAISMSEQLGEEGDTFSMKFDQAGTYEYYCEPHRGAGMMGVLTVT